MKTTPLQDELIRLVSEADAELRESKKHALERAKIVAATEVAGVRLRRDAFVRAAIEAGVSRRTIGRDGLGTKAPSAYAEALVNAAHIPQDEIRAILSKAAQSAPGNDDEPTLIDPRRSSTKEADLLRGVQFEFDDETGTLRLSLGGATFEAAARNQDWDPDVAIENGFRTADFNVNAGLRYFDPADGVDFIPEFGLRHPVVAWAREPKNEATILNWLEEHYGDEEV